MEERDTGAGVRRKILLIDDSEAHRRLMHEALRALHIPAAMEFAEDGEQALTLLAAAAATGQLPHLIMLDVNMPKLGGLDVLRAIRTDAALRTIPVIILSSSRDEAEVDAAYALGANAYVSKPVDNFFDMVGDLSRFWFQRASLPSNGGRRKTGVGEPV